MLPLIIAQDLFVNLQYHVGELTIEFLKDELYQYGYTVLEVRDYDMAVILEIRAPLVLGQIRVDRILKSFETTLMVGEELLLPLWGNWDEILSYLRCVDEHIRRPVLL